MTPSGSHLPSESAGDFAIHKVPVEILRAIFGHVVSSEPKISQSPSTFLVPYDIGENTLSYKSCASPLALSHVCRQWRTIALAFPDIWATFRVIRPGVHLVHLMHVWLIRSKSKPLTFWIRQGDRNDWTCGIMALLLTAIKRWKSVVIEVDNGIESFVHKRNIFQPLVLQKIQITLRKGFSHNDHSSNLSKLLHSSPQLSVVSWNNSEVSLPLNKMKWANITHLTLYATQTLSQFLSALGQCQRLETLSIHHQNNLHPTDINLPVICLPALRSLSVGSVSQLDLVFGSLMLPSLTKLIFFEGFDDDEMDDALNLPHSWNTIHDLIARSSCVLKSMSIANMNIMHQDIYVLNIKALNIQLLNTLNLLFISTSSKIHFGPQADGGRHVVVRASEEEDEWPKVNIHVPRHPDTQMKPSDVGCAVRYAFAFEAEHSTN